MNWTRIQEHYEKLMGQVYPQPDEQGRIDLFSQALLWSKLGFGIPCKSVIDIGCGEGFGQEYITGKLGMDYTGIAWGSDVEIAQSKGRNVFQMDMNSMDFEDKTFDAFIMSHSWEHSPMPLIMLMEAKRITKKYGVIMLPHPDWYKYRGRNHFSVMLPEQACNLFEHAGYKVMDMYIHKRKGSPDHDNPSAMTNDELWFVVEQ